MSRRFFALAALLAALALVVSGCGGDDNGDGGGGGGGGSDEEQVTNVTQEYFDAFLGGDGGAACDLLTDDARQQIEDTLGDCGEAISGLGGLAGEDAEATVENVKVDGDTATADITISGGGEDKIELEKVDGEWRIGAP